MRYNPVKTKKSTSVNMSTKLFNTQEIDSKVLKKDGADVLTENDMTNSLTDNDTENKIPSLKVVKLLLNTIGGANKDLSLFSDIQSLKKEKIEIHSKSDILLEDPDFNDLSVRKELIDNLNSYDLKHNTLIVYMNKLINQEVISDEDYIEFNELVENYVIEFDKVNKSIQLSNQSLMDTKSNNMLERANESIKEIASQIVYKIEVTCDNGPFYRLGEIDANLTAKVYKGTEDITSQFNDMQFVWSRKSNNELNDTNWNLNSKRGTTIHIGNEDYERGGSSFVCSLYDLTGRVLITSNL